MRDSKEREGGLEMMKGGEREIRNLKKNIIKPIAPMKPSQICADESQTP